MVTAKLKFFSYSLAAKFFQGLVVLMIPFVITAADYITYNRLLAIISLTYIVGSLQFVQVYARDFYRQDLGNIIIVTIKLSIFTLITSLIIFYIFGLNFNIILFLCLAIATLCSNIVITNLRLIENYNLYGKTICAVVLIQLIPVSISYFSEIILKIDIIIGLNCGILIIVFIMNYRNISVGIEPVKILSLLRGSQSFIIASFASSYVGFFTFNWLRMMITNENTASSTSTLYLISICAVLIFVSEIIFEYNRKVLLSEDDALLRFKQVAVLALSIIVFCYIAMVILAKLASEIYEVSILDFHTIEVFYIGLILFLGCGVTIVRWHLIVFKGSEKAFIIAFVILLLLTWANYVYALDAGVVFIYLAHICSIFVFMFTYFVVLRRVKVV
jgi:hypothetical protein